MLYTNESKQLIEYYKSLNIIFQNNPRINTFHKNIFNKVKNINNIVDECNISGNLCNNEETNSKINKVYNEHFIDNRYIFDELKKYVKEKKTKLYTYKIPYKFSYITINFYLYKNIMRKDIDNMDKLVKNMMIVIYLITVLTGNSNTNKSDDICSINGLEINLFMTPFKRQIDNFTEVIGAENVNGGFCYGCIKRGCIVVYRKQEVFKVFLHELIHNFGYDHQLFDIPNSKFKLLKDNFNLSDKNIGFQECLVEFWAIFLNTSFVSYLNSKNNINRYISFFNEFINYEIIHSFYQVNKILKNNKIENYIDLLETNHDYNERTHVFSYYVIKSLLLLDYDNLICDKLIQSDVLEFDKKNISALISFIVSLSHSEKVKKLFNIINNYFEKTRNSFIINNMRLSSIEIEFIK